MVTYTIFLSLFIGGTVRATVIYQGCFKLSDQPPDAPIVTYNQGTSMSLQSCANQAISDNAQAFGLRKAALPDYFGYCYTGPLSAFTAPGSRSAATYCAEYAPGDNLHPCGMRYPSGTSFSYIYTAVVYTVCYNSSWSAWSACSQTCDKGVQNRYQTLNTGTGCTPTKVYQYQSCSNTATCQDASTRTTTLQSQCASLNGYYAYSSCYFLATSTGSAATVCASQNAIQASLFGADLVSQLGSVFLRSTSVTGLISLQYVSGSLKWVLNGTNYPFLSNNTITPPTQSCVSLISNKNTYGSSPELPHLNYTACSSSQILPMCMRSDPTYSSYTTIPGIVITELLQSPESKSMEPDVHACGARCSRIISCLGFNYRASDGICIPTKVSYRTPISISGIQVYSIHTNTNWAFYDRV